MTDISFYADQVREAVWEMTGMMTAPSVLHRPSIFPDGDQWCALLGDNLQVGIAGFGNTPYEACVAFDKAFHSSVTPAAALAAAKGEDK